MKYIAFAAAIAAVAAVPQLGAKQEQKSNVYTSGDRACMVGDSITEGGWYEQNIMLYYTTRFPEMQVDFRNIGISGDICLRILNRMESDVLPQLDKSKSVTVLMIGMNDVDMYKFAPQTRAKIGEAELRRRIGYIPQQGRLFSGTVESNLKFAGDMVSDEDMRQAARVAQAEDFIAEREDGYDSPISQGGSNVSGGQRQRLAIARALAKKPEVVVFDDSFSALDYKTDARLREELAKNVTDAALVVVAQRIATIMHADQIIVLDDGHVVGTGTHKELLRSCPAYLEIAQSQLSAEELGLTQEEIAAVMEGGER